MDVLTDGNISLRRFQRDDLQEYVKSVNEAEVNSGALFDGPISLEPNQKLS